MENFDDSHTRWLATDYVDLKGSPLIDKMISYHSIRNTPQHLAKCGCWKSHTLLWKYIITNKLNGTLILEDDACRVGYLPLELPQDGITYLGGFFHNKKMTDNTKFHHISVKGINKLDKDKLRILMTMAYYIPTWQIAKKMLESVEKPRIRAIDVMLYDIDIPTYYQFPAPYIEADLESTIRKDKRKHSNELYQWK
tara:strand:+ start:282 stop:869 length:588 start_codon:yes stop_codon:yes gene_type:complete